MVQLDTKLFLTLLFTLIFANQQVTAQSFINSSSVDLYDMQLSLINPGALKFQDAQLVVGSKILHYGFVDNNAAGLHNSYVSVTVPGITKMNLGVGFLGVNLNTPFYSENKLNLLAGVKLNNSLGIGTQFGILTKSFNRDRFVLVDPGDPVFKKGTSKIAFNIGLGAYWQMNEKWQFGFALQNLNRPNISLIGDNVHQSRVLHFSANYLISGLELFGGFVLEGNRFFPGFGMSTSFQGIGILTLGVLTGNLDVTGQLHITEKISFDYKYSYPLSAIDAFSNGSHRVSLSYRFGDIPALDFEVFATVDTQRISEERLYKNINDGLARPEIVKYDYVGNLKSAKDPVNAYYYFMPVGVNRPLPSIDFDPFLIKYREITEFLGRKLQANNELKLRIIVARNSERYTRLARSFSDYFQEKFGIGVSRIQYGYALFDSVLADEMNGSDGYFAQSRKIESRVTHFVIKPIISRKYNRISGIKSWALFIKNSTGDAIQQFQGNNGPPAILSWDWTTPKGNIVGVGKYTYYLEWKDKNNRLRRSRKREMNVTKAVREITVDFTKKQQQKEKKHLRIDWFLGK
jgi:hypothetical protein